MTNQARTGSRWRLGLTWSRTGIGLGQIVTARDMLGGRVNNRKKLCQTDKLLDLLVFVLLFQALNCPPIYFLIEDRAGVSYYYYYY